MSASLRGPSAAVHLVRILLVEAVVYALLCGTLVYSTEMTLAWSVVVWLLLFVATRVSLVLATFAFSWWTQRPWHLSLHAWLRMLVAEFWALLRFQALILAEPWRRDGPPASSHATLPLVILLHGIYCSRGVWRPVMRHLQQAGDCEVRALDIAPCTADLASQTQLLIDWLETNVRPNRRAIVVTHSLGGLIARGALSQRSRSRVDLLICIGTPHAGSRIAEWLHTRIAQDLCPKSSALAKLATTATDVSRITCLYTEHDELVIPASSAVLPGTRQIKVSGVGHLALIYSPVVLQAIRDALRDSTLPICAVE